MSSSLLTRSAMQYLNDWPGLVKVAVGLAFTTCFSVKESNPLSLL